MKLEPATRKPVTYKNVLFFLGLFALFGCPCVEGSDNLIHRDYIGIAVPNPVFANGEEVDVRVWVEVSPGEQNGQTVTVTPLPPEGWQVTPASREVTLGAERELVESVFRVRTPDSGLGARSFAARRTYHSAITPERFENSIQVELQANLVEIDANLVSVPLGGSQTFTVNVRPRGNTAGNIALRFADHPDFSFSPNPFTVELTQGATAWVSKSVTVSATANAATSQQEVRVLTSANVNTGRVRVNATSGTGQGGFTISASPTVVDTPFYTFSAWVTFTLTSVGDFSGDVEVAATVGGNLAIFPVSIPETFVVNPGAPTTFTRRFQRYGEGTADVPVTFTATHAASSTTRTVVITGRHP